MSWPWAVVISVCVLCAAGVFIGACIVAAIKIDKGVQEARARADARRLPRPVRRDDA